MKIIQVLFFCLFFALAFVCIGYGFYVGFVDFLVGGVITVIEQIKAPEVNSSELGWAIAKIIFFELPIFIGFLFSWIFFAIGGACLTK